MATVNRLLFDMHKYTEFYIKMMHFVHLNAHLNWNGGSSYYTSLATIFYLTTANYKSQGRAITY